MFSILHRELVHDYDGYHIVIENNRNLDYPLRAMVINQMRQIVFTTKGTSEFVLMRACEEWVDEHGIVAIAVYRVGK
jgi:hypothetical protein